MTDTCNACEGECDRFDLATLLVPRLSWLWRQLAAAGDRRIDTELVSGTLRVLAPQAPDNEERAAGLGLLGDRPLEPGVRRTVDLAQLTSRLQARGAGLTPGIVAAHHVGRPLAVRARMQSERQAKEERLLTLFGASLATGALQSVDQNVAWTRLKRARWVSRLIEHQAGDEVLRQAIAIVERIARLDRPIDRRRLVENHPHALDEGTVLGGLVLAVLAAANMAAMTSSLRETWRSAGVLYDELTAGALVLGIAPVGWSVPPGAVVTLPPQTLESATWPQPPSAGTAWVFVTENPSVVAAAAELSKDTAARPRLVCTSGTPARTTIRALGALASAGWRIAIRADFDAAGLDHVTSVLSNVSEAVPWRMATDDYLYGLPREASTADTVLGPLREAGWDLDLQPTMSARGAPVYEEALLSILLEDLAAGQPPGQQARGRPGVVHVT